MVREKITILMLGGGAPGYPLIYKALRSSEKYDPVIIVTEVNKFAGNLYLDRWVDKIYLVPFNDSSEFIPALLKIVEQEKVDFLFSMVDEELQKLSAEKNSFEKFGCDVLLPPAESLGESFNKKRTFQVLDGRIPIPQTIPYRPDMKIKETFTLLGEMAVVKACRTRGNRHNYLANDLEEFEFYIKTFLKSGIDFLCQEYIDGDEFNVSLMLGHDGEVLYSICRQKIDPPRTRANTLAGLIVRDEVMEQNAVEAARMLHLVPGASNVEFLRPADGVSRVIEVNGGRHAAQDYNLVHCGVNIPELLIDLAKGVKVSPVDESKIVDGLVCLKFLDEYVVPMSEIDSRCQKVSL